MSIKSILFNKAKYTRNVINCKIIVTKATTCYVVKAITNGVDENLSYLDVPVGARGIIKFSEEDVNGITQVVFHPDPDFINYGEETQKNLWNCYEFWIDYPNVKIVSGGVKPLYRLYSKLYAAFRRVVDA